MKTVSFGELETQPLEAFKSAEAKEKIAITYGRKKEIKAMLMPNKAEKPQRKLGILKRKVTAVFVGGHNTTEEEFFGV